MSLTNPVKNLCKSVRIASLSSPVHAAVDGLPILVSASPPGVVPEAAPVALLLIADNFRNLARASNEVRKDSRQKHSK